MKSIRELRAAAFKSLRKHYFLNVVIVFVVSVLISGGYRYASEWDKNVDMAGSLRLNEPRKTNFEIIEDLVNGIKVLDIDMSPETTADKYTKGYLSVFVNETTSSGSLGFGIINGINQIAFRGRVDRSIGIFIMTGISALFWVFFKNLILIGQCRYFIERRIYPETRADRLFFIFKTGHVRHTAWIMLVRSVRQTLWNATIIGGIYKRYEYLLIPYLLAENPNLTCKEAFALSKELMNGYKRRAFRLDLSLLPYILLDGFTLHMSSLFFLDPFREIIYAEMYMEQRAAKRTTMNLEFKLYDTLLAVNPEGLDCYPDYVCPTRYHEKHKWLTTDWDRSYGGDTVVLFFFFFSLIGWVWEVFFYLVNDGEFINRGTMLGPWLPIYGIGGWIIIYLMRPLRKTPQLMFIGATLACGSVEYFASWILEKLLKMRWWDYTGYFMNLNGRICLEGVLVFGFAGVTMTYFIAPVADNLLAKIPKTVRKIICITLAVLFFADLAYSALNPNTGDGITGGFY